MPELKKKDTLRHMQKKGFVTGGAGRAKHHVFLEFIYEGKVMFFTKISHSGEIHSGLIAAMAKQCKLSKNEFVDFAKCIMSKDEYIERLKEKQII